GAAGTARCWRGGAWPCPSTPRAPRRPAIAPSPGPSPRLRGTWATPTARRKAREARYAARRAGHSRYVEWLARAGVTARGLLYVLIGILAIGLALGNSRHPGGQSGALRGLAGPPPRAVLLVLARPG